jgi:O-antigen/teichoic acid export membrane protein
VTDDAGAISRSDAVRVAIAAALGSLGSYVVLAVAARTLTPGADAQFLVFWSALFLTFGVLGGIQNEVTRTVSVARAEVAGPAGTGAAVLPVALVIGAVGAALLGATSPWWGGALLGDRWPALVGALCLGALAFSGHAATAGALAGRGRWSRYALVVGAEGTARPVLAGLAAAAGAGAAGLGWASAAAAAAWVVLLAVPAVRAGARARSPLPRARLTATTLQAMLATAASSVLLVGFAVLLSATSPAPEVAAAAPVILAVTLTRAPVMIPLQAFQGVAIAHVVAHRDRGLAALAPVITVVGSGTAVVALLAWWVGEPVMRLVFGPANAVPGSTLAGLVVASGLLALVTLTGAVALALGDHRRYAAGWVAATVVTTALLLVDLPLAPRVVLALCGGPLVGAAVHLAGRRVRTGTGGPAGSLE